MMTACLWPRNKRLLLIKYAIRKLSYDIDITLECVPEVGIFTYCIPLMLLLYLTGSSACTNNVTLPYLTGSSACTNNVTLPYLTGSSACTNNVTLILLVHQRVPIMLLFLILLVYQRVPIMLLLSYWFISVYQ